jgi:hypothetical protein
MDCKAVIRRSGSNTDQRPVDRELLLNPYPSSHRAKKRRCHRGLVLPQACMAESEFMRRRLEAEAHHNYDHNADGGRTDVSILSLSTLTELVCTVVCYPLMLHKIIHLNL